MNATPSENDLRSMLSEGQTLYQISRKFNTTIPEIFKLCKDHNLVYPYQIPRPTKQDLESMYIKEGMTLKQIGSEFDVDYGSVGRWIRNHKIPTRGCNGTLAVSMPSKEVLQRMYIKEGMTQYQISRKFNVDRVTVNRWLRYYNISTVGRMGAKVPMPSKDDLLNYIAEGLNQHQIAEKYEVCDALIFKWCDYYGIPGMVNNFRCTTPEHHEWKFAVFDRDHRTCQMCGATNTIMHPHHIVPFADNPEVAYELENGITLCKECHVSIRGREYDYIQQFAAITQPHLRDHEVIESMPWEPPLPPLSDKLFPDYQQEAIPCLG